MELITWKNKPIIIIIIIFWYGPWGWVKPWTWLMLQVDYIECLSMNPEVRWDPELDSGYKSITLNILIWTLRLGETLKLTHVTSQLHWIFWYGPWGWVRPWTWLMLQVDYIECLSMNILIWTLRLGETLKLTHVTSQLFLIFWHGPWGWVKPWTWLTLQVQYIEYLGMNPEVGWDPELDSRYKSITLNIFKWTLRLDETLNLTHVQVYWIS